MTKTIMLLIDLQDQGLDALQALEIRNAIEEQIEANTTAEVVGADIKADGTEIGLHIQTSELKNTTFIIKDLMEHIGLQNSYKIVEA